MNQTITYDLRNHEYLKQILNRLYSINGIIDNLAGEVDLNYKVTTSEGVKYCLKISTDIKSQNNIDLQCSIIEHLRDSNFSYNIPELIPSSAGNLYEIVESKCIVRLQKWVEGEMLSTLYYRSPELIRQWASITAELSTKLSSFEHPEAHRFYNWDPSQTIQSKENRKYIQSEENLKCADYFWNLFESEAEEKLKHLRMSVNYNDAHEHNILIHKNMKEPEIIGLIDFGDALYTHTINELAIACSYAAMDSKDPLHIICGMVHHYNNSFELEEIEIEILFYLITGRLLISASTAASNAVKNPSNHYLQLSAEPAWNLLHKLKDVHPKLAEYRIRNACSKIPCIKQIEFNSWLNANHKSLNHIVDFTNLKYSHIDLSIGSLSLGNNVHFKNSKSFQKRLNAILEDHDLDTAIGGYNEYRPFYEDEIYIREGDNGNEWRTLHLGIDVWSEEGTNIYCPLDAEVYASYNNKGNLNYGPTLILKHQPSEGIVFYTLYGHLKEKSIQHLKKGMPIKSGEKIAEIGSIHENGNWPSHLHFQLILDILNYENDFPGLAFPNEAEIWLSLCPDPSAFFPEVTNHNGLISKDEILKQRKVSLGKSLSVSYNEPLHIVRAFKQFLYDDKGRRYLDTVNNVPHVGHQHPRVVKAAQDQMELLNTNTRYLNQKITDYSEHLLKYFPAELSVVHFLNSGSEANELALRMVEAYNSSKQIIAVQHGYHGNTSACISISSYKFDGKGGKGVPSNTHLINMPDLYRGVHDYKTELKQAFSNIKSKGKKVGGFICESILSCGGQIVLPDGFLSDVYQMIRQEGGLCIADEVQTGFGRVGEKFWGFELQGVIPDIVTLGKPIGNGHPLATVICTKEVASAFANGMEYFNTFGGNPVSCAIGHEVLKIIEDEKLQENALTIGNYLIEKLKELQKKHPIIGDVRGKGLFLGFEMVKDDGQKSPATEEAKQLVNRMKEKGVLMSVDGPFNNVIKIKPPICFNIKNADYLLSNLSSVLSEKYFK